MTQVSPLSGLNSALRRRNSPDSTLPTQLSRSLIYIQGMSHPLFVLALVQANDPPMRYTGGGLPKGGVMIVALVLLYFLPSMLAFAGGKRRKWKIVAVNVLAGWTIIGWIVSMIMNWAYEAPENDEGITDAP